MAWQSAAGLEFDAPGRACTPLNRRDLELLFNRKLTPVLRSQVSHPLEASERRIHRDPKGLRRSGHITGNPEAAPLLKPHRR